LQQITTCYIEVKPDLVVIQGLIMFHSLLHPSVGSSSSSSSPTYRSSIKSGGLCFSHFSGLFGMIIPTD
jgi:hypothetical protein